MKKLFPARGLNTDRCTPQQRLRAELLALSYPAEWVMPVPKSVVYLPQSGDRLLNSLFFVFNISFLPIKYLVKYFDYNKWDVL